MDKKIGVSILLGVLILIGVVGVSRAVVNSANASDMLGNASMVIYGDGYSFDNLSKGGTTEIVNITISYGLTVGNQNITNITIDWNTGNYTFLGWVGLKDSQYHHACMDYAAAGGCESGGVNSSFANVTVNKYGTVASWNCTNMSTKAIHCFNSSSQAALGPDNHTLQIRFNVSVQDHIEDREIWNITANTPTTTTNSTTITTYIDGLSPGLSDLNISDGNMTYVNGSFNGTSSNNLTTYLDALSPLTVQATFYEQNPHLVKQSFGLYYNGSWGVDMITGSSLYVDGGNKNATITAPSDCVTTSSMEVIADRGQTHRTTCTWTIPAKAATDSGGNSNETIAFGFVVNDTLNNLNTTNDTSDTITRKATTVPFSILTNDTLPYMSHVNVTDQYQNTITRLDGSQYLGGVVTIKLEVSGGPRAIPRPATNLGYIQLFYNVTGTGGLDINGDGVGIETTTVNQSIGQIGGVIEKYDAIINVTDGNYNSTKDTSSNLKDPGYKSLYSIALGVGGNISGNTIEFAVVIGNTSMDNLNGNYTRTAGPYSFKLDNAAPTITSLERVTTNAGITQSDSVGVEYKCSASDTRGSGIKKYVWTLIKPNTGEADSVTQTSTSGSDTITFKNTDINELGDYLVRCVVYDTVGNYNGKDPNGLTGSSEGFTVSAGIPGTGGPSDGGPGARITFDVDFTAANEGTLKAQQGRIKSFSFDGVTKHTITFTAVTASSATLKIESTPVTITLNVGETKDVDINADGINDISVKLNEIKNTVADVTIRKIEEGAARIVEEEETARGVEREERVTTTPVEKKGMTWLWILVAVIVIGALGYYFFVRKK